MRTRSCPFRRDHGESDGAYPGRGMSLFDTDSHLFSKPQNHRPVVAVADFCMRWLTGLVRARLVAGQDLLCLQQFRKVGAVPIGIFVPIGR
jgi:hypothetical protein